MFRSAQHDSHTYSGVLIERVDEIRDFYQFTGGAQSSYPLSQGGVIQPNPYNQWNF
jgi:hypothetical protein